MSELTEFILSVIELVKCEIRLLKLNLTHFILALFLLLTASLLLAGAAGFFLAVIYIFLNGIIGQLAAALVAGIVSLLLAILLTWIGFKKIKL